MKITLIFVPPGGGEADYQLSFEMQNVPQPGDYISIHREGRDGTEDFIVKRTWWGLSVKSDGSGGILNSISVECEFAKGHYSSDSHNTSVQIYEARKGITLEFDNTAY